MNSGQAYAIAFFNFYKEKIFKHKFTSKIIAFIYIISAMKYSPINDKANIYRDFKIELKRLISEAGYEKS